MMIPAARASRRGRMRRLWMKSQTTANSSAWRSVGRTDNSGVDWASRIKEPVYRVCAGKRDSPVVGFASVGIDGNRVHWITRAEKPPAEGSPAGGFVLQQYSAGRSLYSSWWS